MSTEKLADKIPDVYFDWYARLIPGVLSLIFYFVVSNEAVKYSAMNIFLYCCVSYLMGHTVQPLSSLIIYFQEKIWKCNEILYRTAQREESKAGLASKVSKAHAESVSMMSTAILIGIISIYLVFLLIQR